MFVRISAPSHYRRAFLHDGDEDSASKVLCELATWQQIPVAILAGGNWKWEWGKCSEQLVGHLKMSVANASKLEGGLGKMASS